MSDYHPYCSSFMNNLITPYRPPSLPPTSEAPKLSIPLSDYSDVSRDRAIVHTSSKPVFTLLGPWQWLAGATMINSTSITSRAVITEYADFKVTLASATANGRLVHYLSKFCKECDLEKWQGFDAEIALLKLGRVPREIAPTVLGIYCEAGRMSIAMAPPHPSFWIHASPSMPHSLKQRCVDAVALLHSQGILHGDLQLCNILIGGDANVTIINYQKSRLYLPLSTQFQEPFRSATIDDLNVEMRKFCYLLDYRGAQALEDFLLEALLSSELQDAQEILFLNSLQPQIDKPCRFDMPGQSTKAFTLKINMFLDLSKKGKGRRSGSSNISLAAKNVTPYALESTMAASTSHPQEVSARKRKCSGEATYFGHTVKKVRFTGKHVSEHDNNDPDLFTTSAILDPDPLYSGGTSSCTKDNVIEANIQRCMELGLPHPDAIRRNIDDARWDDPDVMEYLYQYNRWRNEAEYSTHTHHHRPLRSLGNLKRAMHAISHPPRMVSSLQFDTNTSIWHDIEWDGGKRKRNGGDDDEEERCPDINYSKRICALHRSSPSISPLRQPRRGILKKSRWNHYTLDSFTSRLQFWRWITVNRGSAIYTPNVTSPFSATIFSHSFDGPMYSGVLTRCMGEVFKLFR